MNIYTADPLMKYFGITFRGLPLRFLIVVSHHQSMSVIPNYDLEG